MRKLISKLFVTALSFLQQFHFSDQRRDQPVLEAHSCRRWSAGTVTIHADDSVVLRTKTRTQITRTRAGDRSLHRRPGCGSLRPSTLLAPRVMLA